MYPESLTQDAMSTGQIDLTQSLTCSLVGTDVVECLGCHLMRSDKERRHNRVV